MLSEPHRPQALADVVQALQRMGVVVSHRMLDDAIRDEPELPMPKPMGTIGRNRIWDPLMVESALPALRDWFDESVDRSQARRAATVAAQKAAFERRQADEQAAHAWGREQAAMREQLQAERREQNEREEAERAKRQPMTIHGRV